MRRIILCRVWGILGTASILCDARADCKLADTANTSTREKSPREGLMLFQSALKAKFERNTLPSRNSSSVVDTTLARHREH